MRRRALAAFETVITTVAPPRPAVVAYADLMLTRARATFFCLGELHASARVGGEHAPHALRVVDREHPGDESARGAAHHHERNARRRDHVIAGARDDLGLLVARVLVPRAHRRTVSGHRDGRLEGRGPVERYAELGRHPRF